MIVSRQRSFVFVHIPKTGGDSVTHALRPQLRRREFVVEDDFRTWLRRVGNPVPTELRHLHKHSGAREIRAAVGSEVWSSSFTFSFVRHPVDRMLSIFHYAGFKAAERRRPLPRNLWYLTPPGRVEDPLQWPAVRAYLASDCFSSFIRHPELKEDRATEPQWRMLCDESGTLLVDYVGKLETIDVDFARVLERIGLEQVPLRHTNASRALAEPAVSIDLSDAAYLRDWYADDFEQFEYDA